MADLPIVEIPRIEEVFPEVNPDSVTDSQDEAYNAWCTATLKERLNALKADGHEPRLKTAYPGEAPEDYDTIALDPETGEIVVVDFGADGEVAGS